MAESEATYLVRPEHQIGRDAENVLIAQTRLNDLAPQSVLAILCRGALAPELAQLGDAAVQIAGDFYVANPNISGDALDRRLADFGLVRPPAAHAYGVGRFYREAGTTDEATINQGLRVGAFDLAGNVIEYTVRGPLPAGVHPDIGGAGAGNVTLPANAAYVDVVLDASATGDASNVGAGAINHPVDDLPAGVGSVTNLHPIANGVDEGSDAAARRVFFDFLAARPRSTPEGLVVGAETYTRTVLVAGQERQIRPIADAKVLEHLDAPGPDNAAVTLYLIGANNRPVSDATLIAAQQRIDGYIEGGVEVEGWAAAGIKVRCARPALRETTIRVRLDGANAAIRAQLARRLEILGVTLGIGERLRRSAIYAEIVALPEHDGSEILEPAGDVVPGAFEVITVTAVEVT